MYWMISARSTNAESVRQMWKRGSEGWIRGWFRKRTDGFGEVARGHHENILFVLEFVELR